jgi:hypothetical protein
LSDSFENRRHQPAASGIRSTRDPPSPTRTATLLTREGAYQTAANQAFTHLTHEYVRAHLPNNR